MTAGTDEAKRAFRPWLTDGVPASGVNEPDKTEIRAAFDSIGLDIVAASAGGDPNAVRAVIEPIRDDALAAAGFSLRSDAITFAPKMSTGETTSVRETDTGTHAAVAGEVRLDGTAATVGELIPNEGYYTKQASGVLWRTGNSERQLSAAQASIATAAAAAAINAGTPLPISRSSGPGAAAASTVASTLIWHLPPFDADGAVDELDLWAMATGTAANAVYLMNADNTPAATLPAPAVWSATGLKTMLLNGTPHKKGQWLAFEKKASGGSLSYTNGAVGVIRTSTTIGGALTDTAFILRYAIRWRQTVKADDNRKEAEAGLATLGQDMGQLSIRARLLNGLRSTSAAFSTKTLSVSPARPVDRSGNLTAIYVPIVNAGLFAINFWSPDGSGWKLEKQLVRDITATGRVKLVGGVDYDTFFIPRGWMPTLQSITGGSGFNSGAQGVYYSFPIASLGQTVTATKTLGASFPIDLEIQSAAITHADLVETAGDRARGVTRLTIERFLGTSTPANWTLAGWTVNNGLVSPAVGGWAQTASYDRGGPSCTRKSCSEYFTIATASTAIQFGIGYKYTANTGAVIVNCTTQQLEFYDWINSGTGVLRAYVPIPFAIAPGSVAGRDYTLRVRRKRQRVIATLRDVKSRESVVLDLHSNVYASVMLKGPASAIFVAGSGAAGDVIVRQFETHLDVAQKPFAVFFGDSITEGQYTTDDDLRSYAEMLDDRRNAGDVVVYAIGGQTESAVNTYIDSVLAVLTPVHVVLMLGTNDTVTATWQSTRQTMVNKIVAVGAIPILCTLPPRSINDIAGKNALIRAGTFGNYPVADIARAVSNDDSTWIDSSWVLADGVHPTTAGNTVIADAFVAACPWWLDGSPATALS